MARRSRFGYRTGIPSITTQKGQTKNISYVDGINTYKDNDDVKATELVAAVDARMVKIGRYGTRKGCDRYSVPLGEGVDAAVTATTGASTVEVSSTSWVAQKLTAGASERLTKATVKIAANDGTGTVLVEVYSDSSGSLGNLLARGSISAASIGSSAADIAVYFISAPLLTSGSDYWFVVKGQESVNGSYLVSTTTDSTNAKVTLDSGQSWNAAAYSINCAIYVSDDTAIKGVYRAYRPNGQKLTLFAAGSSIYSVNDTTGATTAIKTGLNSAATHYRFQMVQDSVQWVNGLEKPYSYDFTTVTEVTGAPYNSTHIIEHKGLTFYIDAVDKTRLFYSNFGEYTAFTSTDFIYVPAPKSYDSLTGLAKLNGVLFLFANRNKFMLLGSDNATFVLDEAPSQRGTFTQESLVWDDNYIYHADAEGIHQFNGSTDRNLAEAFLEDYMAIPSKENIVLEKHNNRLYIFHTPIGEGDNSECWVYNLLLDKLESKDTGTYIGRTFGRHAQDGLFIQASNRVAALYYGELSTNDYNNLGDQLQFELRTSYTHFDNPGSLKRIPKWRPVFGSVPGDYAVEAGYAIELQTDATYQDVDLTGSGPRFDTGLTFDSGAIFSGTATVEPKLIIPGSHKRIQRRYRHIAAREPVEFDSEILQVETQRLI